MLEGLPSLDADAREICALAGAGSIEASVQPLLQASTAPAHAQVPSVTAAGSQLSCMQHSRLPRQGAVTSTASVGAAAAHCQPLQNQHGLLASASVPAAPSSSNPAWYAGPAPDTDADSDDVLDSLSSVLSNRFYMPRPSLSYESRKAAAAAAASRQQPAGGVQPVPTVASGSAAAADAAALTLAGIASSGRWAQWPPAAGGSAVDSIKPACTGMWDILTVRSPRSNSSQQHTGWHQQLQPTSPRSSVSSRRAGSRSGYGFAPSGLPFPLPSCPESPLRAVSQGSRGVLPEAVLCSVPPALAHLSASMHDIEQQLLLQSRAAAVRVSQQVQPVSPVHSQPPPQAVPVQLSAEAAQDDAGQRAECSRGGSFESCVSARSRFSLEGQPAAAAAAVSAVMPAHTLHHTLPDAAGLKGTDTTAASSTAGADARAMPAAALLSAALPAGVDVQSLTVGQLLQVLTDAVMQQQ